MLPLTTEPRPARVVATGVILVAVAAGSWGLWSLFLRPTGLPGAVAGPLMFAALALGAWPLTWRAPAARWDRTAVLLLAGSVAFDALNAMTFFEAMNRTTVAIAVLTHCAAPVWIALAAPWIDGVKTRGARPAALLAFAGLALVLAPWRDAQADDLLGAGLGLGSSLAYAGNVFVNSRLVPRLGAARALSYHAAGAALVLLPFAWPHRAAIEGVDVARIAVGTAILGVVAGLAYLRGLVIVGPTRASMLALAEPLVAVAVGVWVWAEPLAPSAWVGAAMVLGAALFVARAPVTRVQ